MSGSLAILTCASLMVAVFNPYLTSFIVMFLTASTSSSDFYSFSLVKIALKFYLYEVDARLYVSSETLLASVIYPSSYSFVTLKTTSQILTLDIGVLLLSLKVVMGFPWY